MSDLRRATPWRAAGHAIALLAVVAQLTGTLVHTWLAGLQPDADACSARVLSLVADGNSAGAQLCPLTAHDAHSLPHRDTACALCQVLQHAAYATALAPSTLSPPLVLSSVLATSRAPASERPLAPSAAPRAPPTLA